MQYESIILELMSRIKKLEEEVEYLKSIVSEDTNLQNEDGKTLINESNEYSGSSYKKMTEEMIEICYKFGKKVHSGANMQEIADDVVYETGMNRNSAIMYLQVVCSMLDGVIYKRAINSKAIQKYFENIWNEYGSVGLQKAIKATRLHMEYRKEFGHTVDSIEELCVKAERKYN